MKIAGALHSTLKRKVTTVAAFTAVTAGSLIAFGTGSASAMSYGGYNSNDTDYSSDNSYDRTSYSRTVAYYENEEYTNESYHSSEDYSNRYNNDWWNNFRNHCKDNYGNYHNYDNNKYDRWDD